MKLKPRQTVKNPRALLYKRFTEVDISFNQNAVYRTQQDSKCWLFNQESLDFVEVPISEINVSETILIASSNVLLKYKSYDTFYFRYKNGWSKQKNNSIENVETETISLNLNNLTDYSVQVVPTLSLVSPYIEIYYDFPTVPSTTISGYVYQDGKKYSLAGTAVSGEKSKIFFSDPTDESWGNVKIIYCVFDEGEPLDGVSVEIYYETESADVLSAKFSNIGKYQTNKYYFAGSFDYMVKGQIEGSTTQFLKGNITPLTSLNIKHYNDSIELQPDDLVVIGKHLYSVENPETTYKQQPKPYAIHYVTLNSIL